MKVYFTDQNNNYAKGLSVAYEKAIQLIKVDCNITNITFLFEQKKQFEILSSLGFSARDISNCGLDTKDNYRIRFCSTKTYQPNLLKSGEKPSEILIAVCISPQTLYLYEDYTEIAYWVVVPQCIDEYRSFFSVWEAEDCTSSVVCSSPSELDNRIANAVDWLMATSFPNEGYNHPSDEDRLKNAAVTLKKIGVNIAFDQVMYYCLHNGFRPSAARKTAEYFVRAQTHRMVLRDKYPDLIKRFNMPR